MSIALTAGETSSIKTDLLAAFAPTSARLVRAQPGSDGTGGQEPGHEAYRTISVGITNRQDSKTFDEGGRPRTLVTATGMVSIDELEYLHEGDVIEIETDDAREYEHWVIDAIVVGPFLVRLSLINKGDA